ncbi:MAG: cation-transporting P-type ATPase, partial [Desulfobacca sp.]|nr:cation-transporting P-type ATPase [Desulfobacca sp.]
MVQPIHTAVPGRARYRVEGLYRSETLKQFLELRLTQRQDISYASASPLTGNILVCFNTGNSAQSIAAVLEDLAYEYQQHIQNLPAPRTDPPPTYLPKKESQVSTLEKLKALFKGAEGQPQEPWHLLEPEEVLNRWQTSRLDGLTHQAARQNLRRYGPNRLPESEPRSRFGIFLDQFKSLPVALLGAAAGISILTGGAVDALLIMGVVTINALIGYKTESEAEKIIQSLQTLVRPLAQVRRGGQLLEISSDEVTLGDLLVLRPGTYVAGDSRLVEVNYLSVDESPLTGESLPVVKSTQALQQEDLPLGDRVNMVFMGTLVTGGEGLAVVAATGSSSQIGRIQTLVGEAISPPTPMERQLDQLGEKLVWLCFGICGMVFVIGSLWGFRFIEMLRTSICLAAAAVPEGLPTVATTTLALGIRHMRRHHALVRHLDAVETLGAVQTVCLDKTGTITRNQMSVVEIYTGRQTIQVSNGNFWTEAGPISPSACVELRDLLQMAVLCNETEVKKKGDEYILQGSSTEGALVHTALRAGIDVVALREQYPRCKINYRSEKRLFMGTLHDNYPGGQLFTIKGSPLEVLARCDYYLQEGQKLPLTEEHRLGIETENERMAGEALRVLGVAYSVNNHNPDSNNHNGLIWLGIIGMADPIREGVAEVIAAFHRAGIETVMITGDQSPTAYAIGKKLRLSQRDSLEILDSTQLNHLPPEALRALARRAHVFARVSPAHKLQIVQALQQAGKVVAMTGDGINDGPALKAANVGIAMGHTGTDMAREVADVVLEKDNLETLIISIRDGRTIYNNIRKSVHFFLATNLSEIMLTFAALAVGLGSPLNAMQLLWINLISDIFPGLALALEAPEPDILERPPRDPGRPIFTGADFKRMSFESATLTAGALGAYSYGLARYGRGLGASTMAFHSLTTGQLLHAISCRSEEHSILGPETLPPNHYLNAALAISLFFQFLTIGLPALRTVLGLTPVKITDGL